MVTDIPQLTIQQTEEVVCAIALGSSENTLDAWSGVRVCAADGDLNIIFRRESSAPSTPA